MTVKTRTGTILYMDQIDRQDRIEHTQIRGTLTSPAQLPQAIQDGQQRDGKGDAWPGRLLIEVV